jgi:Cysteine-rich CWC
LADAQNADARCPRCGAAFHCGAREASCACQRIRLDDVTLAELRQAFAGCLCLDCLRALHAGRDEGKA